MGVYIKGINKPYTCDDCIVPLSKCDYLQKRADECPLIEIDLVKCGECKYQYMCGHQINRHGLTLKLTCCEYGERRKED